MSSNSLLVVHVYAQVRPEYVDAFKAASVANAAASIKEPGVARFDIVQGQTDPTQFVFVEVFRSPAASDAHKETSHYLLWRDTVAPMMATPRQNRKFTNVFPSDGDW